MPERLDSFAKLRMSDAQTFFSDTGWNLQETGEQEQSLLQEAISARKLDIAEALIKRGVPLDVQDAKGRTALHYAVAYEDWDLGRRIMEAGASPNISDAAGNNVVWAAVLSPRRNQDFVRVLMANGADAKHKNKAGRSALDFCLQIRNKSLWLICGGKDDEFKDF